MLRWVSGLIKPKHSWKIKGLSGLMVISWCPSDLAVEQEANYQTSDQNYFLKMKALRPVQIGFTAIAGHVKDKMKLTEGYW